MGIGGTSGMVTETCRLDNLEPEVVGRTCGAPDRAGISKKMGRLSNLYRVTLLDCVGDESRARKISLYRDTFKRFDLHKYSACQLMQCSRIRPT